MYRMSMKSLRPLLLLLVAGGLGACGNVSHKVAAHGMSAGELVWPAETSVTATHNGGSFPVLAALRLIKPGINKQQVINLIGAPHFSEGLVGVREWNYLFNFRDAGSETVTTCQYKILFDEHKLATSFYWKPAACAERLVVAVPEAAPAVQKVRAEVISTDALFTFDKYSDADITSNGKQKLDALAQKIVGAGNHVASITVAGYTDRLGGESYNVDLSKKRANTVMRYLVGKGAPESRLSSDGYGETYPVVQCTVEARAALISCLAPNRRVIITVTGT